MKCLLKISEIASFLHRLKGLGSWRNGMQLLLCPLFEASNQNGIDLC
jgi:hypothetical protein